MSQSPSAREKYLAKLRDPRWQRKRLEIFERDGWACLICGDQDNTLHAHHRNYLPGRAPWEYEDADLATLCEDCHEAESSGLDDAAETFAFVMRRKFFSADIDRISFGIANSDNLDRPDAASILQFAVLDVAIWVEIEKLVSQRRKIVKKYIEEHCTTERPNP